MTDYYVSEVDQQQKNPSFNASNSTKPSILDVLNGTRVRRHSSDLSTKQFLNRPSIVVPIHDITSRGIQHDTQYASPRAVSNLRESLLSSESSDKLICKHMKESYAVIPGSSWGSLTPELQRSWTLKKCDKVLTGDETIDEETLLKEDEEAAKRERDEKRRKRRGRKGDPIMAGLPDVSEENKEWCRDARLKYKVQPMKSWGNLPMNEVDSWKRRNCDLVFTSQRMSLKPISNCLQTDGKGNSKDSKNKGKKTGPSTDSKALPLIAIMAASTTRKIDNPSTKNLALFMYMLPSLMRTLDCGFRYEYVLGYDKGDPYYDSEKGMREIKDWFTNNVEKPLLANGIVMKLRLVKVNNTLKKPGPVFNEMARAAFRAGADYFYRINDDTEMLVNWPSIFTHAVDSLRAPYGVVGPNCEQGNQHILTHDFTNRLHMEIFEMNYYPPELTDWWMDDWISLVYGSARTFRAKAVQVIHHTGAHGQRYTVDREHENLLESLVSKGRQRIRKWMLKNEVSEEVLKAFDSDEFKAGFIHRDIPSHITS